MTRFLKAIYNVDEKSTIKYFIHNEAILLNYLKYVKNIRIAKIIKIKSHYNSVKISASYLIDNLLISKVRNYFSSKHSIHKYFIKNRYNLSPVHLACINNDYDAVVDLISYGEEYDLKDCFGNTPIVYVVPSFGKVNYYGNISIFKFLLFKQKDLVNKYISDKILSHVAIEFMI